MSDINHEVYRDKLQRASTVLINYNSRPEVAAGLKAKAGDTFDVSSRTALSTLIELQILNGAAILALDKNLDALKGSDELEGLVERKPRDFEDEI